MGLNINGSHIEVDNSHNRLLNTGRHGNPKVDKISSLTVYSAFERHKTPASQKHTHGDNCHLLYALKGKNGLRTTFGDIRKLLENFDGILEDIKNMTPKYDVVIAIPSNHNVSKIYARRFARKYQCPMLDDVFHKITVANALDLLDNSSLSSSDKRSLKFRLKGQQHEQAFSLKDIPTKFREHFPPLTMKTQAISSNYQKILLVDDLLATGTTLLAGKDLISKNIPKAIVDASCLFSSV